MRNTYQKSNSDEVLESIYMNAMNQGENEALIESSTDSVLLKTRIVNK